MKPGSPDASPPNVRLSSSAWASSENSVARTSRRSARSGVAHGTRGGAAGGGGSATGKGGAAGATLVTRMRPIGPILPDAAARRRGRA
jgi:hypothetical protein